MTIECCICHEVMSGEGEPVSHGMHHACALEFYGEDFADILEGEPT